MDNIILLFWGEGVVLEVNKDTYCVEVVSPENTLKHYRACITHVNYIR